VITVGDQVIGGSGGGSGGGGSSGITSGTYAALPSSPAVGDTYIVTSGARQGSVYRCSVAGIWRPAGLDLGLGAGPSWVWDAESIPTQGNTSLLRSWRPVDPGQSFDLVAGSTAPTIVASSLGGMPALSFTGSQLLRLAGPPVMRGADKTILVAISDLAATGNNGLIAIGDPTATAASVGIFGNFVASLSTRIYAEYDGTATGIYDSGTTLSSAAGIHTIAFTWQESGGVARLYADGAPTATASHTTGGGRGVLSNASQVTIGCGRCNATALGTAKLHGVALVPRRFSDAEIAALHGRVAGRFPA
jgi:hypothetical protein